MTAEELPERDDGVPRVVERDEQPPTGCQHAHELAQGGVDLGRLVEVVERRVRDDGVEHVVRERESAHVGHERRQGGARRAAVSTMRSFTSTPVTLAARWSSAPVSPDETASSKRSVFSTAPRSREARPRGVAC